MQYYHSNNDKTITCLLCRHHCTLKEGSYGICGINYNKDGSLGNKVYNHPVALHIDPIEKKPLFHFLPGTQTFSLGTVGCNFKCPFCQNHSISQTNNIDTSLDYPPEHIVTLALHYKTQSISYTYNEPTIWYPYARDIGMRAKQQGLKNIFVSNGYESEIVLQDMTGWVNAANIDLKSFSSQYYKTVLKADLEGVLQTLAFLADSPIHLEITTLLVPEHNDSNDEIANMARFIAEELKNDIPWHINAFHPDYKMLDSQATKANTLHNAKKIAHDFGIKHVYLGNI
ncbi:MAG TPA: AmmeMemoRadiSam system radical SAM enzyme [Treponemataceae bacterium]|nr:AmmeMemoRadiSam system radical SAM enzyme [Treponemataceae bacterium]